MAENDGFFRRQMSDSLVTAAFVVLSGGFQDAYTYCCRGKVFANAQTGNIVLMSANLLSGEAAHSVKYIVPLLSFLLGIMAAEWVHCRFKSYEKIHWRQMILAVEIALLFGVGFLPQSANSLANALVSFVCALQVQSFHKVHGCVYASTMCIGNLRSGAEAFTAWLHNRETSELRRAGTYLAILLLFLLGAAAGSFCSQWLGIRAVWVCCLLLMPRLLLR